MSAELQEPLLGTASQVRRWVLVEQPGPWGTDALLDSRLPRDLGVHLKRACAQVGARPLAIRRVGASEMASRRVYVACSVPGGTWLEAIDLDAPEDLADLDLGPLARDESVGGRRLERSLLLTCTNGSHDACCAEYGRSVAVTLDAQLGERAWECSHIGGDRFAANVLVLPEGLYYGRLTPDTVRELAVAHDQGRLSLPHLRGRSAWPFDVQAAEAVLRGRLGLDRIDAVRPVRRRAAGTGVVGVELEVRGGQHAPRWRVELEVVPDPREQQLTCSAARAGHPPRYAERLVEPLPVDAPGPGPVADAG